MAGFSYSGHMDTNEPPDTATERTETQPADVQPTHGASLPPPGPYSGPKDKASVISAVIEGRCTTRDAAETLRTTTDQIRAWKARETARRARSPKPAKSAKVFRPVSPPVIDHDDEPQRIEDEGDRPETAPETLSASEPLQDLQIQDGEPTETGGETPQRPTETPETLSATIMADGGATSPPADKRAIALANLQKANAANAIPKPTKPIDNEGSFEQDELETLDNLHRIITRNAKRAESGKDCQGWTASLAIVLDLRRRAAGKDSTLVKTQSAKALSTRNSVVFIGNVTPPTAAPSLKIAKLQPQVIDVQPEASSDAPPALQSALKAAPSYVRDL